MRKSKQNRKKKTSGTNLKVSPLKTYKKQVKRMNNRLKGVGNPAVINEQQLQKYKTRLEGAELHLKNYDKEQEEKKAAAIIKAKSKG